MTLFGRVTLLVGLVVGAQLWGCGKKGPPLAPFVRVPALVTELAVRRLGDEVSVGFTLPTRNRDGTEPADLARVDVYAMTTQPRFPPDRTLDLEEFKKSTTLVASIEVRPWQVPATVADPAAVASVDSRPVQGSPVAIVETLVAATLVPMDPWEDEREEEEDEEDETPAIVLLMTPPLPGPVQREYVVVGVSSRGREAEAQRIAVPLVMSPAPPPAPVVTYTEDVIAVTWEPPPGARAAVQAPPTSPGELAAGATAAAASPATALDPTSNSAADQTASGLPATPPATPPGTLPATPPGTLPATPPGTLPATPPGTLPATPPGTLPATPPVTTPAATPVTTPAATPAATPAPPILASRPIVDWPPASRYDLYEIVESQEEPQTMPQPLNMVPLTTLVYADRRVEFGLERCYAVRTLDVVGGLDVRSGLSAQTCVTFVDTFSPAAPQGLTAVGSEGAVSLIWQQNDEEDLAGYLVLRGLPTGETLQPLTAEPVRENTYRDATAEPGVRYVYAVHAVDTATPPNLSPLSNQAGDAAR